MRYQSFKHCRSLDKGSIREVLVRTPNFIGDCVMARRFLEELRAEFPSSRIVCLATAPTKPVLEAMQVCDEVWGLADRKGSTLLQMVRTVRRHHFDLALGLPASVSSAFLLWASGVRLRVGFAEAIASPFYSRHLRWKGRHSGKWKGDAYLELLSLLRPLPLSSPASSATSSGPKETPAQEPTQEELGSTSVLRPLNGALVHPRPLVVAPGASIPLRQWPNLTEFLSLLRKKYPPLKVILIGATTDGNWSEQASTLGDPLIEDRIGKTTIQESLELCRTAAAVIAMDSGMAHVAASLAQRPTFVLFGPGDPKYILPRGKRVAFTRRTDLACSPCESARCHAKLGYQACLRGLTAEHVLKDFVPFYEFVLSEGL